MRQTGSELAVLPSMLEARGGRMLPLNEQLGHVDTTTQFFSVIIDVL